MSRNDIEQIETIIAEHKRRLYELELTEAKYGVDTPPVIRIEIKDIKQLIKERENQIAQIQEGEKLQQNLSNLLDEQNITFDRLALQSNFDEIKAEIRSTITSTLKDMLLLEDKANKNDETQIVQPSGYLEMAKGFTVAGEWKHAAEYYDKFIEHNRDDWEIHFLRAIAYQNSRAGKHTNLLALRSMNEAIALAPYDLGKNSRARLHDYRGAMLKRLDRLEEAEQDLILAMKWAEARYEVQDITYNLACIYAMTRRKTEMLDCLTMLVRDAQWKHIIGTKKEYFLNYWNDSDFQNLIRL